jgi:thiazole synthase
MTPVSDVVIVGGGVIGLSLALELRLRGAMVTVLAGDRHQAASHAAAGMLAPQAEALPSGPMLELCLQSRDRYPDWIRKIEDLSGVSAGFWPCGILAPLYAPPEQANSLSLSFHPDRQWLDRDTIRYAQPGLGDAVMGGWWLPEDGQVDNRLLVHALGLAAEAVGVKIQDGEMVTAIQRHRGLVTAIRTTQQDWHGGHYILATGAWSHQLLPLPVHPRKGQMLALRSPQTSSTLTFPLQRVLFGEDIYIVPRQDGRILIGATVESVGFTPGNTAGGMQTLLQRALRLVPDLESLPIEESWWGFRPATPDELPILGTGCCPNLTLATGHYRNGILLAPITAHLLTDAVWNQTLDPLLTHFSWKRFGMPSEPSRSPFSPIPSTGGTPMQTLNPQSFESAQVTTQLTTPSSSEDVLTIAGRSFRSRLMTGTGKYRNFDEMRGAIAASGCEIVTVAVRRVQTNAPGHEGLAEALDWTKIWMLPNTAGCKTAEEAVRVARLGREMAKLLGQEDNNFVKLEVIPDTKYLLPDPIGTLEAAEQLVKEGFAVLPYINADPLLAKRLEEVGCATVMPLGSPIGSGQGIRNAANIHIIIENAQVPVVVDAGIGTPSEAAQAMEMGASALLINTAIAQAENPALMGQAMGLATLAGRMAYHAGRIPVKGVASASSPLTGTVTG